MIQNIGEFIKIVNDFKVPEKCARMYRGHSDLDYGIQASVFRPKTGFAQREDEMFYSLMSSHPNEFSGMASTFDRLVHAQHHGLPTRLLDLIRSPLVALYFAVESLSESDGRVIAFNVASERVKNFDSDTLTCICNLSKLSYDEKYEISQWIKAGIKKNGKVPVDYGYFNEFSSVKRLVQLIKNEKPYFSNRIKPVDLWSNYLAMPSRNSPRVVAQSGAFLASGILTDLAVSDKITVEEIDVAANSKVTILRGLDQLGINRMSIYPDIESTAKYLAVDFVKMAN